MYDRSALRGLLLGVALCTLPLLFGACRPAPQLTVADVVQSVSRHADWLADNAACPANFMQRDEAEGISREVVCPEGELGQCLLSCEQGVARACYWLAQDLQHDADDPGPANAVFQRSCKLGVASGCTNRAAYDVRFHADDTERQRCAAKTFERACRLDDPWGCTMYAEEFLAGNAPDGDRENVLAMLARSCKYGDDDPACKRGREFRERLIAARSESK